MNRRKKIISFAAIIMAFAIAVTGCSSSKNKATDSKADEKKLKVVTTIFAPYDFARQIGKEHADVTLLLKPGAESHSFEPTPQDIISIQNCDVFIYVGGENDSWVDKVLSSIDNKDMKIIKLLDCVDVVEEELKEGMQEEEHEHEHDHEEEEKEFDEHVWTAPKNVITIATKMQQVFAETDLEHAKDYEANLAFYKEQIDKLDKAFWDVVNNAKRKTLVFGDRFPLRYFVDQYKLDYFAAFPGCSTETDVSAATIAFLTDKVKEEKIPVIFKIELSNDTIAKSIADATGAKVMTFYSCHNISKDDYEKGLTYTDFMWRNVDALKEALN